MKTKIFIAILSVGLFSMTTMNAQEKVQAKAMLEKTETAMYTCPMHADVKSDKPGDCPKCGMELKKMEMKIDSTKMEMNHDKMMMKKEGMAKAYVCPMHADVKSDKSGKCPKCGMELKEKKMKVKKEEMPKKQ